MKAVLSMAVANLRHRGGRTAITGLIVACGVALMVVLQGVVASVEDQFAPALTGTETGASWVIYPRQIPGSLNPGLVSEVSGMPDVAWAAPRTEQRVLVDLAGEVQQATLCAVEPRNEVQSGLMKLEAGTLPGSGAPGVALEANLVRKLGLSPGDLITFFTPDGRRFSWPLTGSLEREGVVAAGLALVVHIGHAEELGLPAGPQKLLVALQPGADRAWTAGRRLAAAQNASVREPERAQNGRGGGLTLVLVFSLLGPLVGAFLIQNALSISLRERRQELAQWRVIGATRRQVIAMLLGEGSLLGLAGGAAGLALGLGTVPLLLRYMNSFSSVPAWQALDSGGVSLSPWLLVTSLAVGMAVTVGATLRPALAGTAKSVMEIRGQGYDPDPPVSSRSVWAGLILAAGTLAGAFVAGGGPLGIVLSAFHFASLALLLPGLIQVVASAFPTLGGAGGAALSLGARRLPNVRRRAAGGALTLMLAAALLIGFRSLSNAAWLTTEEVLEALRADLEVRGALTAADQEALAGVGGVAGLTMMYRLQLGISHGQGDDVRLVWAFDPSGDLPFDLSDGDPRQAREQMRAGGSVLVGSRLAERLHLKPGDQLLLRNLRSRPTAGRPIQRDPYTVAGVVAQDWDAEPTLWLGMPDAERFGVPIPASALLKAAPGHSVGALAAAVRQTLPASKVTTPGERREAAWQGHREKLGTFLALLYLLTGFAALGVIQASILSVVEQRRELALLRAAGATPRQSTLMVVIQVALPGALGGLLGAASGAVFGSRLVSFFGMAMGTELHGGLSGWYWPLSFTLILALAAAVPAAIEAARHPVAVVLQRQ